MKKGDMRRQAILDAAEQLFYQKGYEGTSIQDVLDVLRLSKGGFYHHFESKMQLLDAICAERIESACLQAQESVAQCTGDALAKLNALLGSIGLFNQPDRRFIRLIVLAAYDSEGAILRDRLKKGYVEQIVPLMQQVILEGYAQGIFAASYPESLAEILLDLGADLTDSIGFLMVREKGSPECMLKILEYLNAYRHSVEVLLNAPYGSALIYDLAQIITVIRELFKTSI